jgi:hypothetical protein
MEIDIDGLQTTFDREAPGELHVRFAGKSASREAGRVLAPVFDEMLAAASGEGLALALHFERLEYFNSSTIAALVQLFNSSTIAALGVTVIYDAKQKWQALSFDALKRAMRPFETGQTSAVRFAEA